MARRSGLGRGLGALIPEDETVEEPTGRASGRCRWTHIEPNPLPAPGHFDEETLVELAASIGELGCAPAGPGAADGCRPLSS